MSKVTFTFLIYLSFPSRFHFPSPKTQIGKGLAEEESLAQVHSLLEVRKGRTSNQGTQPNTHIRSLLSSNPFSFLFFHHRRMA